MHLGSKLTYCKSTRVKRKQIKKGHEKASGNQLLRALKLDGKIFRLAKTTANPICFGADTALRRKPLCADCTQF